MWKGLKISLLFSTLHTVVTGIFALIDLYAVEYIPQLKEMKIEKVSNKEMRELYSKITKPVMKNVWLYSILFIPIFEYVWQPVEFVSYYQFTKDYVYLLFLSELPFYFCHRLMHTKLLRKYHQIHHEHTKLLVGMVGLYTHPVDFVVGNILPTIILPVLLNVDEFTMKVWLSVAILNNIIVHIGFKPPRTHDIHHLRINKNYGYSLYMDNLLGTEKIVLKDE